VFETRDALEWLEYHLAQLLGDVSIRIRRWAQSAAPEVDHTIGVDIEQIKWKFEEKVNVLRERLVPLFTLSVEDLLVGTSPETIRVVNQVIQRIEPMVRVLVEPIL